MLFDGGELVGDEVNISKHTFDLGINGFLPSSDIDHRKSLSGLVKSPHERIQSICRLVVAALPEGDVETTQLHEGPHMKFVVFGLNLVFDVFIQLLRSFAPSDHPTLQVRLTENVAVTIYDADDASFRGLGSWSELCQGNEMRT